MDPRPFATLIQDAGAALILKAANLDEARPGAELGAVVNIDGESGPRIGETVAVVPNPTCTAVNLVPELSVVDNYCIAHPVAARAANR